METGKGKQERVSKSAMIAMIAIVVGLIVVATYANWQNAHRDQIESTTVTRFAPEASASPSSTR
jgi:drug/metabolite transporter (DMT)-like permease